MRGAIQAGPRLWDSDEPIFFQKAIHRVRFPNPVYNKWLLYFLYLCDSNDSLSKYFTGSGIQHFTGKALHQFDLPIAPLSEVKRYIRIFDNLYEKSSRLEEIYRDQIVQIAELKQSILQKAFLGDLTSQFEEGLPKAVQAFDVDTRTPQFTGQIIAVAFDRHEQAGRQKTFGRVKAQKLLHLTEALVKIDLGREPVKDAAGPK